MARERWKNWAGNQECTCTVVRPSSLAELSAAVKRAAEGGQRLRASGGRYSWSKLVPVGKRDAIVRMDRLDRILDFDEEAGTVELECGVSIARLTREAAA